MARTIIWTERAHQDRINIFTYWNERNLSNSYSKKLQRLIKQSLNLISKYPLVGHLTDKENVRTKVLKDYLIIYEVLVYEIVVLSLWDCRQYPVDLNKIIE
jgi:addiction module RelE/StbE family toxin